MNVLVYNGPGSSQNSVRHAVESLRYCLEPYYAVSTISARALQTEPWSSKTSAIVFPGGADLLYIRECKPIMRLLKNFVSKQGGSFIGFCAGGYFGTNRVEFAEGDTSMEVMGSRDLGFFPGTSRGPAFQGFKYDSEEGARAVKVQTGDGDYISMYYNGGSVFVDAHKYKNVEILAKYTEKLDVRHSNDDSEELGAAVILCDVGKGKALLTGPHPEFSSSFLQRSTEPVYNNQILLELSKSDQKRLNFMNVSLAKAGLRCNNRVSPMKFPSLSPLVIVAPKDYNLINVLRERLYSQSDVRDDKLYFKGNSDNFCIYTGYENYHAANLYLKDKDPSNVTKQVLLPKKNEIIQSSLVQNFNFEKYFDNLNSKTSIGSILMYGDVVTSTSTLLDKNINFLSQFPDNMLLHIGSIQINGHGRGGNSWVHPKGVSASTVCVNLPMNSPRTGKLISIAFIQYIAMLAYCKAILSYSPGFENLPVRIKWPNDLYALRPDYYFSKKLKLVGEQIPGSIIQFSEIESAYVKIAGLLVNTNFSNGSYSLMLGCGLNVSNDAPTISLKHLIDMLNVERIELKLDPLPHIDVEKLLAKYMNNLDVLINKFMNLGSSSILPEYYNLCLHIGQIVTLTDHNNARAKIVGITDDYGLLIAKELCFGSDSQFTGNTYQLQPDGNTFDIFRGLISKKVI